MTENTPVTELEELMIVTADTQVVIRTTGELWLSQAAGPPVKIWVRKLTVFIDRDGIKSLRIEGYVETTTPMSQRPIDVVRSLDDMEAANSGLTLQLIDAERHVKLL